MIQILYFIIFFMISKSIISKDENKYIKIPFKTQLPQITKDNLFPNLLGNEIFIEIEVGSEFQKIPINIKFDSYIFVLSGSELSSTSNPYFNEKLSKTFKKNDTKSFQFPYQSFSQGYISNDTIKIVDKEFKEFNFILANQLNKNSKIYSGQIGLRLNKNGAEKDENLSNNFFIKSLMKSNLISNYDFTFNYLNETNGEFVIGVKPEIYNPKSKKENFKTIPGYKKIYDLNWKMIFDNFYFGNYSKENIEAQIEIEYGLILCPDYIFEYFNKSFFFNFIQKKQCEIKSYQALRYITCNKNLDINSIGNINFEIKSLNQNFTFTPQSLFYNISDIKVFVFITRMTNNYWKLGKPFFQNFNLTFNHYNKTIGFYLNEIEKDNKGKKKSNIFTIILVVIILLLIGFLVYYFYFRKKDNIENQVEELYTNIENHSNEANGNPLI